jgi:cation transporter-like permease
MPFSDKPTGDILVLMIAATICFTVLASGAAVAIIEMKDSTVDTSAEVGALRDIVGTLIGLLAGYLAGRARSRPDDDKSV